MQAKQGMQLGNARHADRTVVVPHAHRTITTHQPPVHRRQAPAPRGGVNGPGVDVDCPGAAQTVPMEVRVRDVWGQRGLGRFWTNQTLSAVAASHETIVLLVTPLRCRHM